jgi:hypothetical protein
MRTGAICLLGMLSVTLAGCFGPSDNPSDRPPPGFGVSSEALLSNVLVNYGFTRVDADCVTQRAFAMNPSTSSFPDGSYEITQRMLESAGEACGIKWSDYDFTSD